MSHNSTIYKDASNPMTNPPTNLYHLKAKQDNSLPLLVYLTIKWTTNMEKKEVPIIFLKKFA